MEFFNKKEEVIDLKLTQFGRLLLSKGKFKPVYYSFFDTAVTHFLIESDCLKLNNNPMVFYVVHTSCNFITSLSYPEEIEAGVMLKKIGKTSITYGVSVFKKGAISAAAYGEFIHVLVDRNTNKSMPIPENIRQKIQSLMKK